MSAETINNREAIEMMNRCKQEIISLRTTIDRLQPKADAYDNLAIVLHLLPRGQDHAVQTAVKAIRGLKR